ncbi:MAG: sulfite exporter TauE/SafE family protein [Proteobacteria bacterium]|nr:sulfite exporter TauE/SafE family protein [Pseudomonadota bacterium]
MALPSYNLYLPIAEVNIDFMLLMTVGLCVGIVSGVCGIGGSMISIPALIFWGIPPKIAVASTTTQVMATSFSTYLAYAKKKRVDYKLAFYLGIGSLFGTFFGIQSFYILLNIGQIDLFIKLGFVIILGCIGTFSAKEMTLIIYHRYGGLILPSNTSSFKFVHKFHFMKLYFPSSKIPLSAIFPVLCGFIGGFLVSLFGIGGSMIMIPILLYSFNISSAYTTGTTHLAMSSATLLACIMHSLTSHNVDIILCTTLVVGASIGTQIGAKIGSKFSKETFEIVLATIILILCLRVGIDLFSKPQDMFYIEEIK